jgi:hypothetical protein
MQDKPKPSKKRGAPKGHRGANRPQSCGSTNLEECGLEKKVIEEIPPPPRLKSYNSTSIDTGAGIVDMSSKQRIRTAQAKADLCWHAYISHDL